MSQELLGVGQIFAGRYRIERFLAEGGFGAVYVAEQLATEAHVAVKVLWPHVLQAKDAVEKFEQEARIAGRVNSEHIVRVVDAGFDETTQMPFLVMELLIGEDLGRLVQTHGPLPPDTVVEFLRQTASALDRAHAYTDRDGVVRPIVHRDLKPENLFVARRDNGDSVIKVLDFGIAKVLGATSNVSQEVKGTPLYMAFEQAGVGSITPRTDVWALGLIAFFLLTGQSYWRAAHNPDASLTQLFGEVLSLPIVRANERLVELGLPPSLPPAFDQWFFGCVNRDVNQRFATAGAAIASLAEVFGIVPAGSRSAPSFAVPAAAFAPASQANPAVVAITGDGPTREVNTLLSARPAGAATETSLAVSGSLATPAARSSPLLPILAVVGVVLVGGGVAAGVVLTRAHASTAAPPASSAPTEVTLPPTTATESSSAAVVEVAPSAPPPTGSSRPAEPTTTKPTAPSAKTSASNKTPEPPPPSTPAPKPSGTKPTKDPSPYGER
ncbi:MAG: protein kinase [Myxococcales bacterium]|nr:protein kinase [Myxococcales bacterium]